jgi:uncharacterized protein with ParB-like and HNH nuclease domain
MKASETKLVKIIEGTTQYLVPHFQRPYTWQRKDWETLWDDVDELRSGAPEASPAEHFIGAIVTAPAHSVPEGVTKYLLIDGQQRLTTLLLFLAAIRDRAKNIGEEKLAARIQDLYLTNRFQDGNDQYKLLPTQGKDSQGDRANFIAIVEGNAEGHRSGIANAYHHFHLKLRSHDADDLTALTNALLSRVLLVSIVLERDDNPYAIFESLNAKGQPLSQADLLRNYFFMSIDSSRHDQIYHEKWVPMEESIGRANMEDFIRHFLMREGAVVKQVEVYFTLKRQLERLGRDHAESVLQDLFVASSHYAKFLNPTRESSTPIRERLVRIGRLRATVTWPFLLRLFQARADTKVTDEDVTTILDVIENFLVRRSVCGTIRAELNKLFPALYDTALPFRTLPDGVREVLGSRNYPSDEEFLQSLQTRQLYGAGEARDRAKLMLERIEQSASPKELVRSDGLTIEHILPQTLSPGWREALGEAASEAVEVHLHTLGNLTLTGYNAELSNADFLLKRRILAESNLSLNRDVAEAQSWGLSEIEARGHRLADAALAVWPNFAPQASARRNTAVRGTIPSRLLIYEQTYDVKSWQDVLRITLEQITELGNDVFTAIVGDFPHYISLDPSGMRHPKQLPNGGFYESHLNAEQINRICSSVAQRAGLSSQEWKVETLV